MTKRNKSRRQRKAPAEQTAGTTTYRLGLGRIHKFCRYSNAGELPITAADQGYATIYTLNAVPNSTDLTNLFDQYKIDMIEHIFEMDIADGSLNSTTRWPRIVIAPDYNNQAAPLSEDAVLSYEQSKQYQFSTSERRFSVIIKPKIANTVFRSGVTSAYEMKPSGWLDTTTADVPHYGLRYFVANHNTTSFGSSRIRMYIRFWLSMRNAV